MIYHITTETAWHQALIARVYQPESLKTEGFIHCSDHWQIEATANRFYAQTPNLIVLEIDPDQVAAKIVYENLEGGETLFPHIYGSLDPEAVLSTFRFDRLPDGRLVLPEERRSPKPSLLSEFPIGTPGKLFRSPTPGSRMFDPRDQVLELYRQNGIQTVVVLNDRAEHLRHTGRDLLERYQQAGLRVIYAPVPDFSAPQPGYWDQALEETIEALQNGENTVVHCHAGVGRTGMFTALLASALLGLDADAAVSWVRASLPQAIDTHNQKTYIRDEIARKVSG